MRKMVQTNGLLNITNVQVMPNHLLIFKIGKLLMINLYHHLISSTTTKIYLGIAHITGIVVSKDAYKTDADKQ